MMKEMYGKKKRSTDTNTKTRGSQEIKQSSKKRQSRKSFTEKNAHTDIYTYTWHYIIQNHTLADKIVMTMA